jgi:GDP/UDP-N,N'-diacetylbacillosamine 2-epimerase (hydrolysing)
MKHTLTAIADHAQLDLGIVVTGMHLDARFGETVREIEADGFRIVGRIATDFCIGESFMARGIAKIIAGCCDMLEEEKPDLMLLLGDRGEMLAGAIAAIHLNIPIVHIHGGERSGTIDEPVRHAISKLSHIHLTATADAAARLIKMGERQDCVYCVGAPGLDGLASDAVFPRAELIARSGLNDASKIALLVFHPVVQTAEGGSRQIAEILSALRQQNFEIVGLRPNADLGGEAIRAVLEREEKLGHLKLFTHFARNEFVSWMAAADVMIGNSSAGIIEAATFGTPVINVGSRQQLRERNENVLDVAACANAIAEALEKVCGRGRFSDQNIYGDGKSAERIAALLAALELNRSILDKACVY